MGLDIQNHLRAENAVAHMAQVLHTHSMHHNAVSKPGLLIFFAVSALTIICGLLVFWYLSLRQRQQQLAMILAQNNIALPAPVINSPAFGSPFNSGMASTQGTPIADDMELCNINQCFSAIAASFSQAPPPAFVSSIHHSVTPMQVPVIVSQQVQTSNIQNMLQNIIAPLPGQTVTTTTVIPATLTNSGARVVNNSPTKVVTTNQVQIVPTQTSGLGQMVNPMMSSDYSNNPVLADTLVNRLENSADLRVNIPINLPAPVISDGRTTPNNSIMLMYMIPMAQNQFRSDGPDIPLTVSRVLGPSPTAGQNKKQVSGLRKSGILGLPHGSNQITVVPAVAPLAPAPGYPTLPNAPVSIPLPPMYNGGGYGAVPGYRGY